MTGSQLQSSQISKWLTVYTPPSPLIYLQLLLILFAHGLIVSFTSCFLLLQDLHFSLKVIWRKKQIKSILETLHSNNFTKSIICSLATVLCCVLVFPSPSDISSNGVLKMYSDLYLQLPENQVTEELDRKEIL